MHLLRSLVILSIIPSLLFSAVTRTATRTNSLDRLVPGVVIVKFSATGLSKTRAVNAAAQAGVQAKGVTQLKQLFPSTGLAKVAGDTLGMERIFAGTIPAGADPRGVAAELAGLAGVEYAEPKYLHRISDVPNDPLYASSQTATLGRMSAVAGWTIAKGGGAVVIADVDGGTYWLHEDLLGNLWMNSGEDLNGNGTFDTSAAPAGDIDGIDGDGDGYIDDVIGWNFADSSPDPRGLAATPDNASHGTATASLFGAVTNNGVGMAGTAWNCKVMLINASSATTDDDIAYGFEGIYFAAQHGARVINCSWGRQGSYSRYERDVVTYAAAAGSLIVASAGNDAANNDSVPEYPADYPEVLAVGATYATSDNVPSFSNYGLGVQVFAPGVYIYGAIDGGGYGNIGSGTSFAAPQVAGLAGIVAVVHPLWTPAQIAAQIRVTADSIDSVNPSRAGSLGHGRVNFYRALEESHPGLQLVSASIVSQKGNTYLLKGDTATLSIVLRNILPTAASNISFTASTADSALRILQGSGTISRLDSGAEASPGTFTVVVDSVTAARTAVVRLRWVSNGSDCDGIALRTTVMPRDPYWVLQETPSDASLMSIKAVSPAVAWSAGGDGAATSPIVVRTLDSGATWTDVTGNLSGVDLYTIAATDSLHAWVGTGVGTIYATADGGKSWRQQSYPGRQTGFIDGIVFFSDSAGVALGDPPGSGDTKFVILQTTDGGTTWTHTSSEPTGGSGEYSWSNSLCWTDRLHGWFGTNAYKVRRTTDGGTTWLSAATPSEDCLGVSFGDTLHGVAVHYDGVVAYTTDGGTTWNTSGAPASSMAAAGFVPGTLNVWAVNATQPFSSTNGGVSWAAQGAYPFDGSLLHISVVDSSHAWISTSYGEVLMFEQPQSSSGGGSGSAAVTEFKLFQNYPNPFNPSTTIKLRLKDSEFLDLKVYDVLGRAVATLADAWFPAGEHSFTFNGKGLSTGMYFYRMMAGGHTETRRMLLIK